MNVIKYMLLQSVSEEHGPVLLEKRVEYSEDNLEIVKAEAFNGEYVIEEDASFDNER